MGALLALTRALRTKDGHDLHDGLPTDADRHHLVHDIYNSALFFWWNINAVPWNMLLHLLQLLFSKGSRGVDNYFWAQERRNRCSSVNTKFSSCLQEIGRPNSFGNILGTFFSFVFLSYRLVKCLNGLQSMSYPCLMIFLWYKWWLMSQITNILLLSGSCFWADCLFREHCMSFLGSPFDIAIIFFLAIPKPHVNYWQLLVPHLDGFGTAQELVKLLNKGNLFPKNQNKKQRRGKKGTPTQTKLIYFPCRNNIFGSV